MKAAESFSPNKIAEAIAMQAFRNSLNEEFDSPFAIDARKYGYRMAGGKSDDITVAVGRIEIAKQ